MESIYAAFEVKPEINKTLTDYAGDKIASVRALHRTSARIRHAGGYYEPQDPADKPILGGLLAVRSGWSDITGKAAVAASWRRQQSYTVCWRLCRPGPTASARLHRRRGDQATGTRLC